MPVTTGNCMTSVKVAKIAELNDAFRSTMIGGKVTVTSGVGALADNKKFELYSKVRQFTDFTKDNDPYKEHDFGAVMLDGVKYFWKIDYYDLSMRMLSDDPANNEITIRVLTIMRADEY